MEPRRVLIVDDHPQFADTLGQVLTDHGAQVKRANGYDSAIALLQAETFDALITDFKMGDHDGVELVRAARQLVPNLPAVVITGDARGAEIAINCELGLLAVLPKPVPFRRLLAVLETTVPAQSR